MARGKQKRESPPPKPLQPVFSQEEAEKLGTSLAYDLVFERLRNGTATSQETVFFLKLGSSKNELELEKLREENRLLRAKTENLQAMARSEESYKKVIAAMKMYSGAGYEEEEYYEEDD